MFKGNLYWPGPGHDLFNWGVTWKKHERYDTLDAVRKTLSLDQDSRVNKIGLADFSGLDLRVPASSPALQMGCYPKGSVPGVRLGTLATNADQPTD